MLRRTTSLATCLLGLVSTASSAAPAQDPVTTLGHGAGAPRGHELLLLGGAAGVLDKGVRQSVVGGLQYGFARFPGRGGKWRPQVGALLLGGGGQYGYVGLGREFDPSGRLRLTPSLSVGVYDQGKIDLGGEIQFRSALHASWALRDELRVGLVFDHLSHAGFASGINPGTESLVLTLGWSF